MTVSEFTFWMAHYKLDADERARAQRDAEDKENAQRMSRGMRSLR